MNVADGVLEMLRESGQAVSGEAIAQRLGVSRSGVWKAVERLREDGYRIEAATNRGYLLVSESDVLSAENIRRRLKVRGLEIDIRAEVGSTNTALKELAEKGAPEGLALIAESQTGGKGRLGRSFFSPKGSGLYMSILLRPSMSAEESLAITTAAAVAVAEAVTAVTGRQAMIKWVNDVYLEGRKICGILTEAAVDFESRRLDHAVLGIGVNILEPPGGFPPDIAETAGALYGNAAPEGARTRLAAAILDRFFGFYRALPQRRYMQAYKDLSLLTGLEIVLRQGNDTWEGRALGIDDEARLMVRLDSGEEKSFAAGEVAIVKSGLIKQLREKQRDKRP